MKNGMLVLAVVALLVAAGSTQASLLYSDDFSGAGTSPLNGTTPDITMGAATWTAHSTFQADGINPEWWDGYREATLPFNPASGKVYTLSLGVLNPDPDNNEPWSGDPIGIGFGGGPGLKFYDGNGNIVVTYGGPLADVNEGSYGTGAISVAIVLDTQPTAWTAEWFVNGSSVRGPEAYATNPTITTVTIWKDWKIGKWDDLALNMTPEPATMTLLGLGIGGMLLRRRRR